MTHPTIHSWWVPGPRRTPSKRVWPPTGVDAIFLQVGIMVCMLNAPVRK